MTETRKYLVASIMVSAIMTISLLFAQIAFGEVVDRIEFDNSIYKIYQCSNGDTATALLTFYEQNTLITLTVDYANSEYDFYMFGDYTHTELEEMVESLYKFNERYTEC